MHCDFILRDDDFNIICGIEIDGTQHIEDEIQKENDEYKNLLFQKNNIPLYRISANDVREYAIDSINKIIKDLNENYNYKLDELNSSTIEKQWFYIFELDYKNKKINKEIKEIDRQFINIVKPKKTVKFIKNDDLEVDDKKIVEENLDSKKVANDTDSDEDSDDDDKIEQWIFS